MRVKVWATLTLLGLVGLACATQKKKSKRPGLGKGGPGAGAGAGAERIVDPEAMSSEANKTVDILKEYRDALKKDKDQGSSEPLDVSKRRDDTIASLNAVLDGPGDTVESFMDLYSASDADISELCSPFDNAPEEVFSATSLDKDSFIKEASSVLSDWDAKGDLLGFAMDRSSTYPARGALIAALDSYVSSAKPVSADAFKAWTNEVWSEKSSHWLDVNSSLAQKAAICADGGSEFFANSSEATLQSKGGRGGLVFSIILGTMVAGVAAGLGVEKWQRRGLKKDEFENVFKDRFEEEYGKLKASYEVGGAKPEVKKKLLKDFNARWGTKVADSSGNVPEYKDGFAGEALDAYNGSKAAPDNLAEAKRLQDEFEKWVKKHAKKKAGAEIGKNKNGESIPLSKEGETALANIEETTALDNMLETDNLLDTFKSTLPEDVDDDVAGLLEEAVTKEAISEAKKAYKDARAGEKSLYKDFDKLSRPRAEYYGGKSIKERQMVRGAIGAAGGLLVGVGIGAVVGALGLAGEGQDHLSQLSERYKRRLGAILASVARKRRNARRGW